MKLKFLTILIFSLFLSACSKPSVQNNNTSNSNKDVKKEDTFVGSFKDLLGKNDSLKCTIKSTGENLVDSGVYYIDGSTQKMRADIKTEISEEGKKTIVNSSVIYDKNTMYSWGDTQAEGIKFTMDPEQLNKDTSQIPNTPDSEGEIIDMDSDMNLDCQKWTVDNSLFTPPSTVKFIDMAEKMKEINKYTENLTGDMCKICDSIPGDKSKCQEMYCK